MYSLSLTMTITRRKNCLRSRVRSFSLRRRGMIILNILVILLGNTLKKVLISPNTNSIGNANFVTRLSISTLLALVCFESNFAKVPSNTWWLDISATIHVSNSLQEFRSKQNPNKGEMVINVGDGASLEVEHIGIVSINNKRVILSYDSVVVGFGVLHDGLYMLDVFFVFDTGENLVVNSIVGNKHGRIVENSSMS
ncbi:hypothetical protein CR513_23239, partial [Mucuna pruriens]